MPKNSFNGTRTVVAHVVAKPFHEWAPNEGPAAVLDVPTGTPGTFLRLPDRPSDGDSYSWSNPDNSCGPANTIEIGISSEAAAAGVRIQGSQLVVQSSPGASGTATFDEDSNSWWLEGDTGSLIAVLQNFAQEVNASSNTVAAGAAITPPAVLTMLASGRLKISATTSYSWEGEGTVTPLLFLQINAGPVVAIWSWERDNSGEASIAMVERLDTGAVAGDTVTVSWHTTAGDQTATLGNGVGGNAASLLIEEQP